jgi:hypothetical protein
MRFSAYFFFGVAGGKYMPRSLVSVLLTTLLVLFSGHAFALEPTLVEVVDRAWRSVQGGAHGNPEVSFNGNLTGGDITRERFVDVPAWVVSEDFDGDGIYEAAVQFTEGTLRILSLSGSRFRTIATARKMAPEVPPVVLSSFGNESTGGLIGIDDRGDLVSIDHETGRTRRLASGFSTLSHPVGADLDNDGDNEIVAISDKGYLTVVKGRTQTRTEKTVQLLPDTRITVADMDGDGILEIMAFSRPTDKVSPGRLGDDLEAQGIAVFNWDGRSLRLQSDFELPDGQVFEMLTPIIAQTRGDDDPILMLPVTEENKGTQIRSYSYSRGRLREKREGVLSDEEQWIHILGSSKLGNSERVYLITALISDDGEGDLELYRLDLAQTRITLSSSISTHLSGTRLMETALIGDLDRDGQMELLAPGKEGSSLVVYDLDRNRLKDHEIFNSSGKVGTNICPGDFNGDGISDIIFGLDDGTLVLLTGE